MLSVKNSLSILILIILFNPQLVLAESCNEIADEIRAIKSPAFDRYQELNDIKQDILLVIYSTDRAQCDTEKIGLARISRDYIIDFDAAYGESISNSTDTRIKAVNTSIMLEGHINELDDFDESELKSEERDLINSAKVVYYNFLLDQADDFSRDASNTSETKEKIALLYGASNAYSFSGESLDSLNMRAKAELLEERYLEDRSVAEGHMASMRTLYKDSMASQEKGKIGKIEAYVMARGAFINGQEGLKIYSYHGEIEKIDEIENQLALINETKSSLLIEIITIFSATFIILSAFAVYFLFRIKQWIFDTNDMTLGNDIIKEENLED